MSIATSKLGTVPPFHLLWLKQGCACCISSAEPSPSANGTLQENHLGPFETITAINSDLGQV